MHRHSAPPLDRRLSALQAALSPVGAAPFPTTEEGNRAHAAVSLILRSGPKLDVLLIRRAKAEGDPWSGQMALPGGRRGAGDPDLLHTAMRETREETGVHLQTDGIPLGRLDTLEPATLRLPPISIHPFVFGVPEETEAHVASPEVDEVLWTPLSHFLDPDTRGTVEVPLGNTPRSFPCFRVEERVVWGLTYRILTGFLEVLGSPELRAALGPLNSQDSPPILR